MVRDAEGVQPPPADGHSRPSHAENDQVLTSSQSHPQAHRGH